MKTYRQILLEKVQKNPIVYHGSDDSNIKSFRTKRHGTETGIRTFGSYFTDNRDMAESFAPKIYKVKLNFKKLIDMTGWKPFHANEDFIEAIPELKQAEIDWWFDWNYYGDDSPYHTIESMDGKYDLLKRWKKKGYDGIAFWEGHFGKKGITYVPFHQKQIKILEMPEQ
jgi:hypothetical protein